jgi:gamma-glutamyl-gamma-aminobutyraldehyde dehydrogenase
MSNMLTKDEYVAISEKLSLPSEAFINGKFTPAKSGEVFETINPATGETIAKIASCDRADVDAAVDCARKVFKKGLWSKKHPSERKRILIKLARLIEDNQLELAVLESIESGKPIQDCVNVDLPETVNCLVWHAEAIDKIYDQISPSGSDALGIIVREPMGVVSCVLPWNFPLLMLAFKMGPALAAGNSMLVKPAEQTSMTTLRVAELAIEAGVPEGVFNVITGFGETAGQAIGQHPDIDAVSFTGSTEVGRMFLEYSARSNLKRIVLECGGKAPSIVLSDATNLDAIAENITASAFWSMGQNCTANSRLIVHKDIKVQLMPKLLEQLKSWRTGNPLDPENTQGAMISPEHFDRVLGFINVGKTEGAAVLCGGNHIEEGNGIYIEPTIFDAVTPQMKIATEEIFGPVLSVLTVDSNEEAIALANDTSYGLHASLYTSNVTSAHLLAREIEAGTVSINCYSEGDITTPFGGYKLSGFGGRDNSLMAHDQYTEVKTIWVDLSSEGAN